MKEIKSAGGPFIGISRASFMTWSGVLGKRFIGEQAPFFSDYEAACDPIDGRGKPPVSIAKLHGYDSSALLIAMPLEIAIVEATDQSALIAQLHYSEPGWDLDSIVPANFADVAYSENEYFNIPPGNGGLMFFDAAYPAEHVGEDFLEAVLRPGRYCFESALYAPDDMVWLTLCRILPAEL